MAILITVSGAVVITTIPWLLEMEAPTYFIGKELVEAIIGLAKYRMAACSEGRRGMRRNSLQSKATAR